MSNQIAVDDAEYERLKHEAEVLYSRLGRLFCPAVDEEVHCTPEGFGHLLFKEGDSERDKTSQMLRFKLLPLGAKLIETSTTYQEYEKMIKGFEVKSGKGRSIKNKPVHYWGIIGIVDGRKIKVILKKIGDDGKLHFWSLIPNWTTNLYRDIRFFSTMHGNPEED